MRKYEAIGVVEAQYFPVAMEILDSMCKAANVEYVTSEKYLGGRLVTLIVGGGVSDVTTAVETAKQVCEGKQHNPLKMALVISNPHAEILNYLVPKAQPEQAKQPKQPKPKKGKNKKQEIKEEELS